MSFISKIFGPGKKDGSGPNPQDAIQGLRETEEMLQKKSDFLEKKIEQELTFAKKNGTKNKRGKYSIESRNSVLSTSVSGFPIKVAL